MNNRRSFIKKIGTGVLISKFSFPNLLFANQNKTYKIVILHTNDVHSNIEPFPADHKKFPGLGGVAARKSIIEKIRSEEEQVILLDAGDIFQGTPYFNIFHGETELKLMTAMGYDACTIGNHDFDGGLENLALQSKYATFPFINCNYDVTNTLLAPIIKPYHIIQKGKIKIGILGVGIDPKGLIPENLCKGVGYKDPIMEANKVAEYLKSKEHCHLIICLSHLGLSYDNEKVSDKILAEKTQNIDLIIGGHTHTFLEKPIIQQNLEGKDVYINQVGWAGVNLGRLDFIFEKNFKKKRVYSHTVIVDKKTIDK
jgi:5'-nucleotidase